MARESADVLWEARPRVIAALLRAFRDLDTAEDAYQEASVRALKTWAKQGIPKDPAAWLILVGRNVVIDGVRRRKGREESLPGDVDCFHSHPEKSWIEGLDQRGLGDDILRLFFICSHPALAKEQQLALALRVVGGLSVPEIARAFLIKPRALEQRITRAKRRLAAADVIYDVPSTQERQERLPSVALMIYLLFNEGYSASGGQDHLCLTLCTEAIRLARILLRSLPAEPEVMGLLALCLLQHSRHPARLDCHGHLVLLEDQDRSLWLRAPIGEGRFLVEKALRKKAPGPFQVQAAIAAVHASARRAEDTDWPEIERLYTFLEHLQPTPVVGLNRAVAISKSQGATAALRHLDNFQRELDGYFHYHGVRGALLLESGDEETGVGELERALSLARTPAEVAHLEGKLKGFRKSSVGLS